MIVNKNLFYFILVAIRLTICQLQLAKFEIPLECKEMNKYTEECVVSLGKVTQFWTTYDGFYRDVGKQFFNKYYACCQNLFIN